MHKIVKAFDFYHDGINPTHYAEGEQELPEDAAAVAEAEGWAEPVGAAPNAPPAALTVGEVVEAIGKLDPDKAEAWTSSGAPQVKALADVLGRDVTAALRDEAWAEVQKA